MNTMPVEELISRYYKHRPLTNELSRNCRDFYKENIPSFLNTSGGSRLYTSKGTLLCDKYERIVIGDYGAFIEYVNDAGNCIIKPGQEYRVNVERFAKNVKYVWLTVNDGSDVKVYLQKRTVPYADYIVGRYYVSVHEVISDCGFSLLGNYKDFKEN